MENPQPQGVVDINEQARISQVKKLQEAEEKRFTELETDIIKILQSKNVLLGEVSLLFKRIDERLTKYIGKANVDEIMLLGINQSKKK